MTAKKDAKSCYCRNLFPLFNTSSGDLTTILIKRNLKEMFGPDDELSLDLQGQLLLADPSLRDGIFYRAVVLLAEHSAENGAFGLILNHPMPKTVGELLPNPEFSPLAKIPVHAGGPVGRDHLTFSALWAQDGRFLYKTRLSAEEAIEYSAKPNTLVRAFVGYSGWAKDQLEDEMENQSWHLAKPGKFLLRQKHNEALWARTLKRLSPFHHILSLAPDNLLAN